MNKILMPRVVISAVPLGSSHGVHCSVQPSLSPLIMRPPLIAIVSPVGMRRGSHVGPGILTGSLYYPYFS